MSASQEERSNGDAKGNAWSISIKPVGAEHAQLTSEGSTGGLSRDFVIKVSPEDDVTCLYEQIEGVTGLKANQQRLIYRGRLIAGGNNQKSSSSSSNNKEDDTVEQSTEESSDINASKPPSSLKIKDITGLRDGHTIHLVRRRDREEDVSADNGENESGTSNRSSGASEDSDALGSSSSAAPLLAALLGLASIDDGEERSTDTGRRWRSARYGTSRRRFHHRLTQEDIEVSDPGSMESVRQGLMTLHTLLPSSQQHVVETERSPQATPTPYPNRQWYVGQWIDCLDTVNQWLEATIVEIVHPDEILPSTSRRQNAATSCATRTRLTYSSGSEPFITAGDLDGRRRLLLERCDEGDSDDEGGDLAGFRRRDSNEAVQLLLIHYNGWPHRWDEWIRSDSERIRPFRVRTRHPPSSSHASPTPQSTFTEAPSTFIRNGNSEARDREALLSELGRVLFTVNDLVCQTAANLEAHSRSIRADETEGSQNGGSRAHLPWRTPVAPPASAPPPTNLSADEGSAEGSNVEETFQRRLAGDGPATIPQQTSISRRASATRHELAALAPLLDRLGRTLIDSAPHVAYLASTMAETEGSDPSTPELEPIEEHPTSLGGLLSLLSRDRRRQSIASNNVVTPNDNLSNNGSVQTGGASDESASVDPDHTDFAYGFVNTTRGEVRRGPRSRGQSDDAAGILGAYLAAASLGGGGSGVSDTDDNDGALQGLGRLLRERGNGGGGIDIHIHAVVTAPGMPNGALGLTTLGAAGPGLGTPLLPSDAVGSLFAPGRRGGPTASLAALNNFRSSSSASASPDEEDMGIFAELYSDTPEPVNPNGAPLDGDTTSNSNRRDINASSRRSFSSQSGLGRNLSNSLASNRRQLSSRTSSSRIGQLEPHDSSRRNSAQGGGMFRRLFRRNTDDERS